jgi:antitoxin HicB
MTTKGLDAILAKPYAIEFVYGETADEGVVAQVAEWPGCMTAGATREEAVAHLEDAMRDWVEARLRAKFDIPEPMATYSGKVLLRMPRTVHRAAEQRAREEGTSLNTWLTTAIARELGPAPDVEIRAPSPPRRVRYKPARRVRA